MKKSSILKMVFLFVLTITIISVNSCDILTQFISLEKDTGTLLIHMNHEEIENKRTILPEISMDVASYTIIGTGPGDEDSFTKEITGTESFSETGLATGTWNITVEAFNAGNSETSTDPVLIGRGSAEILIEASTVTEASIDLLPISGTGSFELLFSWDEALVDPTLEYSLLDKENNPVELTETIAVEGQQGTLNIPELSAGYYLLSVSIMHNGSHFGSETEAIRIVEGQKTSGTLNIILKDSGDLALTINEHLDDPIEITLTGTEPTLSIGDNMTVSAETPEEAGAIDAYAWYLNGIPLTGETNNNITLGAELEEGEYRLTSAIWKGNVICTTALDFSVTNDPYQAIVDTYFELANIVLRADLGAEFDRTSLLADTSLEAIDDNGNIYWDKEIAQLDSVFEGRNSNKGFFTGIKLRTLITVDGNMLVGPITGSDDEQLKMLVYSSLSNTNDFNGNYLSSSIYGIPKAKDTRNSIKHNFLGFSLRGDKENSYNLNGYYYLYTNGYVTNGPQNYHELYERPFTFYNNYGSAITIANSFLINHQLSLDLPFRRLRNSLWSPIGNNPYQDINLARSFNISYNGSPEYSAIYIKAYTDNGMASNVTIDNMNSPIDYTDTGTQSGWGSWAVTYNSEEEKYTVSNNGCANGSAMLVNQYPLHVEMQGNTTWSTFDDEFSIAVVGASMIFSNMNETPSPGDDGNPAPFTFIIPKGMSTE